MTTPGALRTKRYRQRHMALGLCYNCPRKALENRSFCAHCAKRLKRYYPTFLKKQREARQYRTLLGFCSFCKKLPVPGLKVCAEHQREHAAACRRYKEKKAKKRGWKLVRVKL